MPFAAALSTVPDTRRAVTEACEQARASLRGQRPDLALVFFSAHHIEAAEVLNEVAWRILQPRSLLGCSGESIVGIVQEMVDSDSQHASEHWDLNAGEAKEIERGPAVSVWLARWELPVQLMPFHLSLERTADGPVLLGWPDELVGINPAETFMLLLGDPFTFPVELAFQHIEEEHRGLRVMGGMASGGRAPGQCSLMLNDRIPDQGAVGVLVQGPVTVRSVVSQGCRPIGKPMVVTKARENVLLELGGRTAGDQLEELWQELSPRDQKLVQNGLHVGRVINEYRDDFRRGDFLVRNVVGFDPKSGTVAITDRVRVGQTVQFHVRDAVTADEDLHELLKADMKAHAKKPAGALVFTCNGRGRNLFPQPHHDATVIREEAGPIPLAGFFAQGELGPVGGQNFIHGFTASVALFEE
jgi:small ligand-binding sensory domain FIST